MTTYKRGTSVLSENIMLSFIRQQKPPFMHM